jgi:hypothetical protein
MPFVVNQTARSESNCEADDVFPVHHFSESTCVENVGNFFFEDFVPTLAARKCPTKLPTARSSRTASPAHATATAPALW